MFEQFHIVRVNQHRHDLEFTLPEVQCMEGENPTLTMTVAQAEEAVKRMLAAIKQTKASVDKLETPL